MECRLIFFYKTYIHLAVLHVTFTYIYMYMNILITNLKCYFLNKT